MAQDCPLKILAAGEKFRAKGGLVHLISAWVILGFDGGTARRTGGSAEGNAERNAARVMRIEQHSRRGLTYEVLESTCGARRQWPATAETGKVDPIEGTVWVRLCCKSTLHGSSLAPRAEIKRECLLSSWGSQCFWATSVSRDSSLTNENHDKAILQEIVRQEAETWSKEET